MPNVSKEKALEYSRRWREKHREASRESSRRWRAAHPEHKSPPRDEYLREYYRKNKAAILAKSKAYKQQNKDKVSGQSRRYYVRRRTAAGTCSQEQFAARAEMFGGKCWVPGCGKPGTETDHVIALTRGGSNWPANLRPICTNHNASKAAKPWRKWLATEVMA